MRSKLRVTAISAFATAAIAAGGISTTASAQPVAVGNLVNVQITNLLNNNRVAVQIPVNAAANVCGVAVAVLAQDLTAGPVTCTSRSGNQQLTITQ
jgi:hypothetical protein